MEVKVDIVIHIQLENDTCSQIFGQILERFLVVQDLIGNLHKLEAMSLP